jgi:hypothetical protein
MREGFARRHTMIHYSETPTVIPCESSVMDSSTKHEKVPKNALPHLVGEPQERRETEGFDCCLEAGIGLLDVALWSFIWDMVPLENSSSLNEEML